MTIYSNVIATLTDNTDATAIYSRYYPQATALTVARLRKVQKMSPLGTSNAHRKVVP